MGINRPRVSVVIIIPDRIQDLLPRERDTLVLDKIGQELKFLERQLDRLSIDRDLMGRLVDADSRCLDDVLGSRMP